MDNYALFYDMINSGVEIENAANKWDRLRFITVVFTTRDPRLVV